MKEIHAQHQQIQIVVFDYELETLNADNTARRFCIDNTADNTYVNACDTGYYLDTNIGEIQVVMKIKYTTYQIGVEILFTQMNGMTLMKTQGLHTHAFLYTQHDGYLTTNSKNIKRNSTIMSRTNI